MPQVKRFPIQYDFIDPRNRKKKTVKLTVCAENINNALEFVLVQRKAMIKELTKQRDKKRL